MCSVGSAIYKLTWVDTFLITVNYFSTKQKNRIIFYSRELLHVQYQQSVFVLL